MAKKKQKAKEKESAEWAIVYPETWTDEQIDEANELAESVWEDMRKLRKLLGW